MAITLDEILNDTTHRKKDVGLDYEQLGYDLYMLGAENMISPTNYARVYQKHLMKAVSLPNLFNLSAQTNFAGVLGLFVSYPNKTLWAQALCTLWDQLVLAGAAGHPSNPGQTTYYMSMAGTVATAVMAIDTEDANKKFIPYEKYAEVYKAAETILSTFPIIFVSPAGLTIPILVS